MMTSIPFGFVREAVQYKNIIAPEFGVISTHNKSTDTHMHVMHMCVSVDLAILQFSYFTKGHNVKFKIV